MSVADRIGLPLTFQAALLLFAFALTVAPHLGETSFGFLQLPRMANRQRRRMKIVGPLALCSGVMLVIPVPALAPPPSKLRLLAADFTDAGLIDVAVANVGTQPALLTKIELEVVRDHALRARPILGSTATYRIPIDDLRTGARRAIVVRHLIAPSTTERFLIAPQTARALDVRVRIFTADGATLSMDVRTW